MYFGIYSGSPFIWSFTEIPGDNGTFSQESVANIGTSDQPKHFFVGQDNFYVFDGSRPVPVGWDVKEYFFSNLNMAAAGKICTVQNRRKSLVYIYYPSGSSETLNDCIVYNHRTGKWGRDPRAIEFATDFISPGITYDALGTYFATYNDFPNVPYDAAFLSASSVTPAIFNTSHKLQVLNAQAQAGYFVTGDYGNDTDEILLSRVKCKWLKKPSQALMTNYYRQSLGDDLSIDATVSMSDSRFDVLREARWHRVKVATQGDFELNQINAVWGVGGEE